MNKTVQQKEIHIPGAVRTAERVSLSSQIIASLLIILAGTGLGVLSKWLDMTAVNELPGFLQALEPAQFFSRFAVWIFAGIVISVYSRTPLRASLNAFLFFAAMVSAYYLYCYFFAGFYPADYAMIWFRAVLIIPFAAYVCWFAKGRGISAVLICALMNGTLLSQAVQLYQGLSIRYFPDVILWLASFLILRRPLREAAVITAAGAVIALLLQIFLPY
ncbi:MAG: hypothetical protein K6A40_07975 [Solobacterium sp.]|nr:hypothetical protein [Solobacterium sp.]